MASQDSASSPTIAAAASVPFHRHPNFKDGELLIQICPGSVKFLRAIQVDEETMNIIEVDEDNRNEFYTPAFVENIAEARYLVKVLQKKMEKKKTPIDIIRMVDGKRVSTCEPKYVRVNMDDPYVKDWVVGKTPEFIVEFNENVKGADEWEIPDSIELEAVYPAKNGLALFPQIFVYLGDSKDKVHFSGYSNAFYCKDALDDIEAELKFVDKERERIMREIEGNAAAAAVALAAIEEKEEEEEEEPGSPRKRTQSFYNAPEIDPVLPKRAKKLDEAE